MKKMAKKNGWLGILAMVLVFGMTVVGCGGDDGGGGGGGKISVPETNVQVFNKDGTEFTGSGTVRWRDGTKDGSEVNVGTVTDGKLTLDLSPTVEEKYLYNASFNGVDARHSHLIYSGLYLTGHSGIGYKTETGSKRFSIEYVYCNKPFSVDTDRYRINAEAGWNRVLLSYDELHETSTQKFTTNSKEMPSNMKWTLSQ